MTKSTQSLSSLIYQTKQLAGQFPHQLTKQDRLLDAVEEMGELAQAILMVENIKTTNDPTKQRTVADVADALCDVLFDLVILADDYHIDYENEYQDMLTRLQTRLNKGEFKGK
jgi:NTP pyrophosphatase (non-canonical NTP hydrolase)